MAFVHVPDAQNLQACWPIFFAPLSCMLGVAFCSFLRQCSARTQLYWHLSNRYVRKLCGRCLHHILQQLLCGEWAGMYRKERRWIEIGADR